MKHSDWLLKVKWIALTDQTALFQRSYRAFFILFLSFLSTEKQFFSLLEGWIRTLVLVLEANTPPTVAQPLPMISHYLIQKWPNTHKIRIPRYAALDCGSLMNSCKLKFIWWVLSSTNKKCPKSWIKILLEQKLDKNFCQGQTLDETFLYDLTVGNN